MSLEAGTRLGVFEILAPLGKGGMGEVYRARDTKLEREVAVKVLPEDLAKRPDRMARFRREAKLLAALDHPYIAAIHGLHQEDGHHFLVMELVEGQTLAYRLKRGALPVPEALELGRQIAEALEAAHEKDIIHRDLKPSNVMLTSKGRAKVLDFGLACVLEPHVLESGLNTETTPDETGTGVVLGTAPYMSPEQARGEDIDERTDIWAFGSLLFEMLTGRRAFRGSTAAEAIAAILERTPDWSLIPSSTPAIAVSLVRRCLRRDRVRRVHHIADARLEIEEALEEPPRLGRSDLDHTARASRARLAGIGVLLSVVGALSVWVLRNREASVPSPIREVTFSGHDLAPSSSPDGRTLAFSSKRDGRPRIWLKQTTGGDEVSLTEGPDFFPRFSRDGSTILFARAEGVVSLFRVPSVGGTPRKVVDDALSGDWSPDGRQIVFVRHEHESGRGLRSVVGISSVDGGGLQEIARFEETVLIHPRWSPDGRFVAASALGPQDGTRGQVVLVDVERRSSRRLETANGLAGLSSVAWLSEREIVYSEWSYAGRASGDGANVVRHDVESGAARSFLWVPTSTDVLEIGGDGRIVFDGAGGRLNLRVVTLGTESTEQRLTRGNSIDRQPAFSPAGDWIAYSSNRSGNLDLWAVSTTTGAIRRLTDHPADDWDPAFSSDGRTLLWSSNRSGNFEIWTADADGSNSRQVTNDGVDAENPTMTPDGRWIVYASSNPTSPGIWKIRFDGTEATRLVAHNEAVWPELSPDGEHFLYATQPRARRVTIRVARLTDGVDVAFRVEASRLFAWMPTGVGSVGRARWMPGGRAIAFVSEDAVGASGVYVQDFVLGSNTLSGRRRLAGFADETSTESFGIAPDGTQLALAGGDQVFNLLTAEQVAGIQ